MLRHILLFFLLLSSQLQAQNNIVKIDVVWYGNGNPKGTSSFPANSVKLNHVYVNYVTDSIFRYTGNGVWVSCMDCLGPYGVGGSVPILQAGVTTTLPAGSAATSNVRLVSPGVYALDLGIPRGSDGMQGPPGIAGKDGKGIQILDNYYQLTTTTDYTAAIVKKTDAASKMGAGLYVFDSTLNAPTVMGDIFNKGFGSWLRVGGTMSGELYNTAWAGKQYLPMAHQTNPIITYGAMSQAQSNVFYGTGKIDVSKDTYDQAALSYSTSLQGKVGYAYITGPSGHVYHGNRTVEPAPNWEVLPGHGVNNVPNDRFTENSKMGFLANASVLKSVNNTPYSLFAWRITDFSKCDSNRNARSYKLMDLITYGQTDSSTNIIRDTAFDMRGSNGSVIEDCNFYNHNLGVFACFAMHTRINRVDIGGIFGTGIKFSDKGMINAGTSAYNTPCNGSSVWESHFSGETYGNGQWGIESEETDGAAFNRNSFEGGAMTGNIRFEALGSWCKGVTIDGLRNEHTLRQAIAYFKMKEGWPEIRHIWDQSNSVYVDAEGVGGSIIVHVSHTDYLSSAGLRMRMRNGASFDFDHNYGINNLPIGPQGQHSNEKVIWDTGFGGLGSPDQSRFSIAGFRYNQ